MNKVGKIISFVGIGVIAAAMVATNILALGTFKDQLQDFVFGYNIDDSASAKNREQGEELAKSIEEEGIVMVKNEDEVLPLSDAITSSVNVFGWASVDWVVGGSGSGQVVRQTGATSTSKVPDYTLIDALKAYHIDVNTELTNFYKGYNGSNRYNQEALHTYDYEFSRLIEPKMSDYSSTILENALDFSDTALVVLSRCAGESNDAPMVQYKGSGSSSVPNDTTKTYLDASTEELALLEYVGENYENVIVIINSTNTMNLNFLDTIAGLDSCLIVGGTGMKAVDGVVSVLFGDVNPSGKLADTQPYDFRTNASYANSGSKGVGTYSNSSGLYPTTTTNPNVSGTAPRYAGVSYLDYLENIYVGYKWYETADHEGYWDSVNNDYGTGYDGVVQFPFGFGLSHTTFSWEVVDLSKANNSTIAKDDELTITVRVTNTGDYDGKDVVELYYTAPYEVDGIEKSYVELIDFAKTSLLEPGLFEDVTLKVKVSDMASYDCYDMNTNGFTGYELEKGDYQLKLMTDAHNLKTLVHTPSSKADSAVITYKVTNDITYETDPVSGKEVYNRFSDEAALDGINIDNSNCGKELKWLSRSNFEETFPSALEAARSLSDNAKALNLYTSAMALADNDPSDEAPTFGVNSGLRLFNGDELTDLGAELGLNPEDERWETVLDQFNINELTQLTLHGYVKVGAIPSAGKESQRALDGPNQIGSFNAANCGTAFPNATVVAQTWSTSLAYDFGLALGAETRTLGLDGWYGPGVNLHRSPFGGRNYEYYSEDSVLTGKMAANAIRGAKNQGVYCFLKHLICYEQESMRDSIYTWLTEQTLRQTYLKPFEICIKEGGANGIMTSYNRLGATWAGGHKDLIQGVLRDEWGFNGMVLTDYADHQNFMNGDQALRAGGDLWMDGWNNNGSYKFDTSSNTFKQHLRRAGKDVLFACANARATQKNYDPSQDNVNVVIGKKGAPKTWWITTLVIADVVVGVGLLTWAGFLIVPGLLKKKKETASK